MSKICCREPLQHSSCVSNLCVRKPLAIQQILTFLTTHLWDTENEDESAKCDVVFWHFCTVPGSFLDTLRTSLNSPWCYYKQDLIILANKTTKLWLAIFFGILRLVQKCKREVLVNDNSNKLLDKELIITDLSMLISQWLTGESDHEVSQTMYCICR